MGVDKPKGIQFPNHHLEEVNGIYVESLAFANAYNPSQPIMGGRDGEHGTKHEWFDSKGVPIMSGGRVIQGNTLVDAHLNVVFCPDSSDQLIQGLRADLRKSFFKGLRDIRIFGVFAGSNSTLLTARNSDNKEKRIEQADLQTVKNLRSMMSAYFTEAARIAERQEQLAS